MDRPASLRRRRELLRQHLPALGWSLIVGGLLLAPGDALADVGGWDWLDKPVHAVLFGVQYGLLVRSARAADFRRPAVAAAAGSALWALALEAAQLGVAGRSWEGWDLAAGLAGIALAALLVGRLRARLSASR